MERDVRTFGMAGYFVRECPDRRPGLGAALLEVRHFV